MNDVIQKIIKGEDVEYIIEQVGGRDAYESELELLTGELSENYIMYSKQDI